jgi:serine/threonine protein kinase
LRVERHLGRGGELKVGLFLEIAGQLRPCLFIGRYTPDHLLNLTQGTRLGPYEILSPIGAGGMGEVYKARDTRLERTVALKILSSEFSGNAALRARFEREAKSIAQLSHPHICSLFDVGRHDGTDFLVMELLEGQSLADRLARGPLPLAEALRVGEQIAEALAAAHRHGVVHRDLKPGNIMLTRSGAKLLDFGLAKSHDSAPGTEHSALPTAHRPITEQGMVLGTFQYMSPEQLEGLTVDARTDIFALGTVLYEMVTGKRAFEGKNRTSIIAAIVSSEPKPMAELQPLLPAALEQLVRQCLAKEPEERMQSAHDVALGLRTIAAAIGTNERTGARGSKIGWLVAAILAVALAGALLWNARRGSPEAPSSIKFQIPPPPQTNFTRTAAVSPDGREIVFRAVSVEEQAVLWSRALDSTDVRRLPGTEGATFAFWSQDGRHVGFSAGGKLKRLDRAAGTVQTIFEPVGTFPGGASWNRDGVIIFSKITESGLFRVPASGGEATALTRLQPGEKAHVWPSFLPDGKHFLYSIVAGDPEVSGIYVGSLDSAERKKVVPAPRLYDVTPAHYARGHLFYIRRHALIAQPFDAAAMKTTGSPVTIDEGLEISGAANAPLSVSGSGTIVYRKFGAPRLVQYALVDRTGSEVRAVGEPGPFREARLSPDGRRLLLTRDDASSGLWIYDIERGTFTRASFEEWAAFGIWLPDGASFVYSGSMDSPPNVYMRRADGTTIRVTREDQQHYVTGVSPDGRHAIFRTVAAASSNLNLYIVPLSPPHTPIAVAATPFDETRGVVSPDGRFMAYISNESGQDQVYATTFPKPGPKWQISAGGAAAPQWSADGRELYYIEPAQRRLTSVKIKTAGGIIEAGVPQPLFPLPSNYFDATRDGRFLVAKPSLNPSSPSLTVIVGWH